MYTSQDCPVVARVVGSGGPITLDLTSSAATSPTPKRSLLLTSMQPLGTGIEIDIYTNINFYKEVDIY